MEIDALHATATMTAAQAKVLSSGACLSVPVRRIVTFHLNGLTDLVWTLPALAALRDSFPGAHITAVARPAVAALLRAATGADEVLARPRGGLSSQAALMARLHGAHFDMAIAFSPSRNTTLLAWSTGAAVRAGYAGAKMDALLTHRLAREETDYASDKKGKFTASSPDLDSHLALVREVGCATHQHDALGLIAPAPQDCRRAQLLLDGAGIDGEWLLVAPQAGRKRSLREWSPEGWRELLKPLSARWPIVLVGTSPQPELCLTERIIDLSGRTDLPTLAALCARARLACGIDSGALHLSAAMGVPVVALLNNREAERRAPRGVLHRIVTIGDKPSVPAEEAASVLSAVQNLIGL